MGMKKLMKVSESNLPQVIFDPLSIGAFPIPQDYSEYHSKVNNCCGELAVAGVLNILVKEVFSKGGVKESDLKKGTSVKNLRIILKKLGFETKQCSVTDKFKIPKCDLAIVRVAFGEPDQHWMKTVKSSHYIALRKFTGMNYYVLDNCAVLDNKEFVWIEKSEYRKLMVAEKMFVTSYLELKPMGSDNGI